MNKIRGVEDRNDFTKGTAVVTHPNVPPPPPIVSQPQPKPPATPQQQQPPKQHGK